MSRPSFRAMLCICPSCLSDSIKYVIKELRLFGEDEVIKNALGIEYANYYIEVKREEWQQYHRVVSPWEVDRYLDVY